MNTMKKLFATFSLLLAFAGLSFGQMNTLSSTTLSTALTNNYKNTVVVLASTTNITAPGNQVAQGGVGSPASPYSLTLLYIDREMMRVNALGPVSGQVFVERGYNGTRITTHAANATVYFGPPAFFSSLPYQGGSCTASTLTVLPLINYNTGDQWTCPTAGPNTGLWTRQALGDSLTVSDGYFWVEPSSCWFINTTYTGTPAFLVLGASNVFVLNQTTNSAAGTETLTCNISLPTRLATNRGVTIKDIVTVYGVQTTALTSVGTPTLSTITLPAPAATETASTVTPVAVTGTFTNHTVTSGLGTTTAGSFWTVKSTLATPFALTSDLTQLVFAIPFASTTTGVLTINTPGLMVHYYKSDF